MFRILSLMAAAWGVCAAAFAAPADEELALYFRAGVERISRAPLRGINSLAAWEDHREGLRQEFLDMLGLWPLPEKTDLRAVTTGVIERDDYVVEKLHFQSLPGLYVTGNLYRPRNAAGRLPAVLYVCGHAQVVTNGVSCGNKAAYQHHGIWFARHGYVCLLIDTLQLGEIMGDHHGTYRLDQWWWNSRGYTPAGVEAWNGVRAIDYLQSRPDVDPDRIGMTGRSGGGSYTWTTAAIDERVRVAAPVAGITDLHNHVVDGVIEGHCDCMFFLNTHGWDFPLNAALIAPRPLLIVNTDTDPIFPLDGVVRLHAAVRPVFQWYQAATNLGLVIGPGGHKDTQDLQVPVFRWFNQHLKGEDPLIARAAVREIDPLELRVFSELPADAWNTRAQREFGAHRDAPARSYDADTILARLRRMVFGGWPPEPGESVRLNLTSPPGVAGQPVACELVSQPHVKLPLWIIPASAPETKAATLTILDGSEWKAGDAPQRLPEGVLRAAADGKPAIRAAVAPRGVGPVKWTGDARKQIQIRRRFMLLGQTLDGMRVWDIRQSIAALKSLGPLREVELRAGGAMGVNALYAALFEPEVKRLRLENIPTTLETAPDYFNVARVLPVERAIELARERGIEVVLEGAEREGGR